MKIIIPMAGMGKRMRPHTLTVPKPLLPVAGLPIVKRLAQEIVSVLNSEIEEIAFIIGDFGKETEDKLIKIAEDLGAKAKIYYQYEPLGTAHAILCAADSLSGNTIVAFADTLFKADFKLDKNDDAVIWTNKVDNPQDFGVVKVDIHGFISEFIEKPKNFVSDLAIIGIYYFKSSENLKNELQFLIDNKIVVNGEYQLTDALENMKRKGLKFVPATVNEWLDCGNKNSTVNTNSRILHYTKNIISNSAQIIDSVIIEPCFIGDNSVINNSVIGPYVSVGNSTKVHNSVIKESIIMENSNISNANIINSMIGNFCSYNAKLESPNLGDYSQI